MARALGIWLGLSLLGAALIVFLPERGFGGQILFRLSNRHGPSLADGAGLTLVVGGWVVFLRALWTSRRLLEPRWLAWLLFVVAVIALSGCLLAFSANRDGWGAALGLAALAAQLASAFLAPAMRR